MNPQITIDELASNIGRTTRSIEMQIKKLKEIGRSSGLAPTKEDTGKFTRINRS